MRRPPRPRTNRPVPPQNQMQRPQMPGNRPARPNAAPITQQMGAMSLGQNQHAGPMKAFNRPPSQQGMRNQAGVKSMPPQAKQSINGNLRPQFANQNINTRQYRPPQQFSAAGVMPSSMPPRATGPVTRTATSAPRPRAPTPGAPRMFQSRARQPVPRGRPRHVRPSGPRTSGFANVPRPRPVPQRPQTNQGFHSNRPVNRPQAAPARQLVQAKLDLKANCDTDIMSFTLDKVPCSNIVSEQSTLPLAVVINPLAKTKNEIPEVNFGNVGVVRCRRCRAYINPFVVWIDNGRKWRCNLCGEQNETPTAYYRHLDDKQDRVDKLQRPELSTGCVEIFAPSEYMVRPPMPPVYVFCFEISDEAKRTGLLKTAVQAIRAELDNIPGTPRTQVGFIGYDQSVQIYVAAPGAESPQVLSLPDLDDLFLPLPEDLLVNLEDSREQVDKLLDSLEASADIASEASTEHQVTLGGALNAAYNIMAHIGGRLAVFASKLPTLPPGNLSPRGNVNVLGTMSEHTLLRPNSSIKAAGTTKKGTPANVATFYKLKANDFSRQQICCDIFALPVPQQASYVDLASLSDVTKFSGGDLYYYGATALNNAHYRLRNDIKRYLTREMAWEAVMRVRASDGVLPKGFYGNFLLRGNDLMALPSVSSDTSFVVEFSYDTKAGAQNNPGVPMRRDLAGPVTIQTALLYTNSQGERRIRVATLALPITKSVVEVIQSANLRPIVNLYGRKGVDITFKAGLDDFKRKLQNKLVELIRAFRSFNANLASQPSNPSAPPNQPGDHNATQVSVLLPESLKEFPRFVLGIMKSQCFRGGNEVGLDFRSYLFDLVFRMSNSLSHRVFSPTLFDLLNKIPVPCSQGSLRQDGIFVLDTGFGFYVWIGGAVSGKFLTDVFGTQNISNIDESQLLGFLLQQTTKVDSLSGLRKQLFDYINSAKTANSAFPCPGLFVVKQGMGYLDHLFNSLLWNDRQNFSGGTMAYQEFLQFLLQQAQGSSNRVMRR